MRLVQRRERLKFAKRGANGVVDPHRRGELRAAVDDAVADRADGQTGQALPQLVERGGQRLELAVAFASPKLLRDRLATRGAEMQPRGAAERLDAAAAATGETARIEHREFERGRTGVEGEKGVGHRRFPLSGAHAYS